MSATPEKAGQNRCEVRQVGAALSYILVLGTVAACVYLGYLQQLALLIAKLGVVGHILFFCLVVLTGQPWMWGYAVVIQTSAFAYGWVSLLTMEFGSFTGAVLGFIASKRCLHSWVKEKIDASFDDKTKRVIAVAQTKTTKGHNGIFFFSLVRMVPLVTFGWANGIAGGMTDMDWDVFIVMTLIGSQMDLILNTYIGTIVRGLSVPSDSELTGETISSVKNFNYSTPSPSSFGANESTLTHKHNDQDRVNFISLIIQIVLCVLLFACVTIYGRHVLQGIVQDEETADDGKTTPATQESNGKADVVELM